MDDTAILPLYMTYHLIEMIMLKYIFFYFLQYLYRRG